MVEPPVYRRRQQRLWMGGEEKREGTVEIPSSRRRLRRRKRPYKAQAEVGGDAGWEVGRRLRAMMDSARSLPY